MKHGTKPSTVGGCSGGANVIKQSRMHKVILKIRIRKQRSRVYNRGYVDDLVCSVECARESVMRGDTLGESYGWYG